MNRTTKTSKSNETSTGQTASTPVEREHLHPGVPVEHYHGEPNNGKRIEGEGSIEEETLDPSAPYNKTYGNKNLPS